MTDVLIAGNGPAAWSCAMTARKRGLSVLLVAPEGERSLLEKAERVDNYPGLPGISGRELMDLFRKQGQELGAEEAEGQVRQIMPNGKSFLALVGNNVLEAGTVVLCVGAGRARALPGEEALIGMGISYCATCDGMFYRGKRVAVLAETAAGIPEAAFLNGVAQTVDYYSLKPHETNGLPETVNVCEQKPEGIEGKPGEPVLVTDGGRYRYDGIFVFRRAVPLDRLLPQVETEGAFLKVNRGMQTSIPGIFAAGDCTGSPFQIGKAVGEGNVAALSCAEYLSAMQEKGLKER